MHQPGVRLGQSLIVDAEPARRARVHGGDEQIGGRRKVAYARPPFGGLEVEDHALLPAVPHDPGWLGARPVAGGGLDLDYFGAGVGQDHPGESPRHPLGDFYDAQTVAHSRHDFLRLLENRPILAYGPRRFKKIALNQPSERRVRPGGDAPKRAGPRR